jgi:hypothetical protein
MKRKVTKSKKAKPTVNIDIDVGSHNAKDADYEWLTNPAKFLGTSKPRRRSQVTKRPPSKRLVSRRMSNTKRGYFPNPVDGKLYSRPSKSGRMKTYCVELKKSHGWTTEGIFPTKEKAFEYARALDRKHSNKMFIRVVLK